MNLTPPNGKLSFSWLSLIVFLLTLATAALAQSAPVPPCVNQSPRNLKFDPTQLGPPAQGDAYNFVSKDPLVDTANADKIIYQRHELELCDRHYHVPVENTQGCPSENVDKRPGGSGPPPPGQWVEVHTVYASAVDRTGECAVGHDHDLKCCAKPPFVVVGYVALIADHDSLPSSTNHAEWSGSATKENEVTKCNTVPALWHFGLGCDTRLTPATLAQKVGGNPHKARDVQGPNQVSSDLTFVGLDYVNAACRNVRTALIPSDALAPRICPGVCSWPLNSFTGKWSNVFPDGPDHPATGYAICQCCPLVRPQ
jgi:hypothetical protein